MVMPTDEQDVPLEARNDHDLLVVAVTELRHIKNHVKDLAKETKEQNGRLSACEAAIRVLSEENKREGVPKRVRAVERWQLRMGVIVGFIGVAWPLLIYEVRQFVLDKFGFIP